MILVNKVNVKFKLDDDEKKPFPALKFYVVLTGSSSGKMRIYTVFKVYFIFLKIQDKLEKFDVLELLSN